MILEYVVNTANIGWPYLAYAIFANTSPIELLVASSRLLMIDWFKLK